MSDPTVHSMVLAALHDRGGRLVASFELDARGQTVGHEGRKLHACSGCHATGHTIKRCNGAGMAPKPTHAERRRAR